MQRYRRYKMKSRGGSILAIGIMATFVLLGVAIFIYDGMPVNKYGNDKPDVTHETEEYYENDTNNDYGTEIDGEVGEHDNDIDSQAGSAKKWLKSNKKMLILNGVLFILLMVCRWQMKRKYALIRKGIFYRLHRIILVIAVLGMAISIIRFGDVKASAITCGIAIVFEIIILIPVKPVNTRCGNRREAKTQMWMQDDKRKRIERRRQ
jgi:hypothetical protein